MPKVKQLNQMTDSDEDKRVTDKLSDHFLNAGDFPNSNSDRRPDVELNCSPVSLLEAKIAPNIL